MSSREQMVVAAVVALAVGGVWIGQNHSRTDGEFSRYTVTEVQSPGDRIGQPSTLVYGSNRPTFVGRKTCRECHEENFALHAQHGHASTFHQVSQTDLAAKFAGKAFDGGEHFGTYHYHDEGAGRLSVTLPEHFAEERFPLQYALGSGMHAQTMLTLITGLDGKTEGIEHRATCYSDGRIGLTPGHAGDRPENALELFGDSARGEALERCVYCHTTTAKIVGEDIVDLVANVNCEKCHGPGSEHVRSARASTQPAPYSVGLDTWDVESEIQLCGDCHRMPRSVSEKEVREYSNLMVRFQPIGMLRSRCYLEADRQLKCTTCHNPHTTVDQNEASQQVQHCVSCHQESDSTHVVCSVSSDSGCIECHMPAIKLGEGLEFHDHWIRVRGD